MCTLFLQVVACHLEGHHQARRRLVRHHEPARPLSRGVGSVKGVGSIGELSGNLIRGNREILDYYVSLLVGGGW